MVVSHRNPITEIPERLVVPDSLKASSASRRVIPFIGAGVSMVQGLPNWDGFANAVIEQIIAHDTALINHAQFGLIKTLSPRTRLSIAQRIIKQHDIPVDYQRIFGLQDKHRAKNETVNNALGKISSQIITTNYDDLLTQSWEVIPLSGAQKEDEARPSVETGEVYSFEKQINITLVSDEYKRTVYHIHGVMGQPDTMVMSTNHYLERYSSKNDGNKHYLDFLDRLFSTNVVIFIGYGTDELEILEYIFQKGFRHTTKKGDDLKHYILQGFYSYEVGKAQLLSDYFISLGIELIPYSLDKEGYECLPKILEELAAQINSDPDNKLAFKNEMEDLLND